MAIDAGLTGHAIAINYLDVTAAERTAIANERLAAQIRGQHLIASVLLIKALGGGW